MQLVAMINDEPRGQGFLVFVSFKGVSLLQQSPLGSKSEPLNSTSQEPRLKAGGKSSSYLDMCFGFVEQPKRRVPGAVWS